MLLGSFFVLLVLLTRSLSMSKKMMLLGILSTVVMATGCQAGKTAMLVADHVLSIASGVDGLNNLFRLGLPAY
jgi:hypothetical protein